MKARAQRLPDFGLGGSGIGNLYGALSDAEARATVHAALRAGAGLIDTAPYYGHGRSETRIGAALATWGGAPPLLSSKVGRVLDPVAPGEEGDFGFVDPLPFRPRFDYSRAGVRRSLEESLSRLGVARLDIALVHDVGAATHGVGHDAVLQQVQYETLPALMEARREGLVDRIGIGVNEIEVCLELLKVAPLDVILIAGRYTLFEQTALALLDHCHANGVEVLVGGVFNSGLLAAKPHPTSPYNYEPAPSAVRARAMALWSLCEAHGVAPQAAAVQFPMLHPGASTLLIGARSAAEIEQIALWRAANIPSELWNALKQEGYVQPDAPC